MKPTSIAAAIIWSPNQKQLLITERLAEKEYGGFLEFPGGKIEEAESPEQGLIRELEEELNITPTKFMLYQSFPFQSAQKEMFFYFYHIWKFSGLPHAQEGQKMYWLNLDDIDAQRFPPANTRLIVSLKTKQSLL